MDLERMRHSAAHVMAAAVSRLYADVKLDIGPSTEDGFYYDFDLPKRLSPEDFPEIEAEMARIIAADLPFERIEVSREEAVRRLQAANQPYKLDRLQDIPEGEVISFYRCGDFEDLCRGPHVTRTGEIAAFKLISVAGSYFRGIETNPMLQRIYGIVAESQDGIRLQLERLEEARKRDHRVLGRELGLFSVEEEVGPGLVLWHPKGARIRLVIEDFWRREHLRGGYELLFTPHIGRGQLWERSGHLVFYRESMYPPLKFEETEYFLKPMNCPFHIQVYRSQKRSYRDLPLRWAELGTVYRYEKSGVLHGLFRVRGFTQDDAHIFCTPQQIQEEVVRTVRFALGMLRAFGFSSVRAYLSTRPHKAVGSEQKWQQATSSLQQALQQEGIAYTIDEAGGAFYGPKIDLKIRDAIGREWQLTTVQFDFNLPERFGLVYTGEDGREHQPYMVHRALLGSLERFVGILTEHYAGAFPFWLAPEQVRILPVTEKQSRYGESICTTLSGEGFRATCDLRSETIGAKIRHAQLEKIPYMLVVGAREEKSGMVSLRSRLQGDLGTKSLSDVLAAFHRENVPVGREERSAEVGSPPTRSNKGG
ncbi:MAG: threonine--tRNA ligase [Kiritimatiellae bacterium]|nr:threonine--tRNA ligase [Kiritimatiellia bacterium]